MREAAGIKIGLQMQSPPDEFIELINARIERLRPKLLDLSRRNPLVSTKLSARSNAVIRVVDELPDILFYRLNNAQEMRFVPLPAIEDDPADEQGEKFVQALANARLTDADYRKQIDQLDSSSEDYLDRSRHHERELKDKVRAAVGLPPRPTKADINLVQHARNNGVSPSYDLPMPDENNELQNHTDENIQTLFLPKDLERKLSALNSKCNTWIQETGINVLHAAFGFLEWKELIAAEASSAPLILLPVKFERRKSKDGLEFWVTGLGEEAEVNTVLQEKLRLEFGVQLPPFEGGSVETYLQRVSEISPKTVSVLVRRQVAFGVFPSARIAMYHDLNTATSSFASSDVIRPLFAGNGAGGTTPFADDYFIDQPEVENKVPHLVLESDASQFSTLVDVANGNNIAVEGPPGTGKSQTIVNAIAAAMAAGKKVLFVSEKTAALDVVRSRLEAIGLGPFVLPLLADRSTRENVMTSVRNRVEMEPVPRPQFYEQQIANFRSARDEISAYIKLMTTSFEDSGLTIHQIIGASIATSRVLDRLPKEFQFTQFPRAETLSKERIEDIVRQSNGICDAWQKAESSSPLWKGVGKSNLNRFDIDEIAETSQRLAALLTQVHEQLAAAAQSGFAELGLEDDLTPLIEVLDRANDMNGGDGCVVAVRIARSAGSRELKQFLEDCTNCNVQLADLQPNFHSDISEGTLEAISEIESLCRVHEVDAFDDESLGRKKQANKSIASTARDLAARMKPFVDVVPDSANWRLSQIQVMRDIADQAGRDALYFRNAALADPASAILVRKFNKLGQDLVSERAELAPRVSLEDEISAEQLQQAVAALRAGGFFRWIRRDYRHARHLVARILKAKFRQDQSIDILEQLIAWKRRAREFSNDTQAAAIYGAHFRGIGTDFELFDRLAQYFEKVRDAFGSLEHAGIRQFMLSGSADHIVQIPALDIYPDGLSVATIQDKLPVLEAAVESFEAGWRRIRELRSLFRGEAPTDIERLSALKRATENLLHTRKRLATHGAIAAQLGTLFGGATTDVDAVAPIADLAVRLERISQHKDACHAVIENGMTRTASECLKRFDTLRRSAHADETRLIDLAGLASHAPLLVGEPGERAMTLLAASAERESLFAHSAYAGARETVDPALLELMEAYAAAQGGFDGVDDALKALAYRTLARRVFEQHGGQFGKFSGSKLDEWRNRIASLDRELIKSSQQLIQSLIQSNAKPPRGIGAGRKSQFTEMALIDNETSKKQRFIPVRDLTKRAGKALLELKPCWMMSPLAVAQYLPKSGSGFDLCIIDEASQMTPEDAVGALARCRQAMIVGDTNQLPPSSFFQKLVEDDDADADEAVLNESILEMANAVFRPARRLRWHYRSRHSGLIRFSNRLVYNDDLVVFPSATEAAPGMGVAFRAVEGLYKSGTNPIEAKAMVEAAIRFVHEYPNRSLGIVTLNQKQRELIFEEMEYALSKDAGATRYVEDWATRNEGLEQFFVKNLENVQGDERDAIFIGTVYGPESVGARVMQRFGPINGVAGKRRLNVLFSRAKQLIVTFSSMTAADISAEPDGNEGAYMLKRWLEYAATGTLDVGVIQPKEPDSDFEMFVIDQIKAMGCIPVPQVGVKGYSIDIGVKHPQWPHGFILGVECDGAAFHSSKSARDRDRLRQEVLEGLGWKIHRIWSTDWFNNPSQQAHILRQVIEARLLELNATEAQHVAAPAPASPSRVDLPAASRGGSQNGAERHINKGAASDRDDTIRVSIGDTVRVRYLSGDKNVVQFTISRDHSDPSSGVIHYKKPIAEALLGAEEGEEVEILVGSYLRPALLEKIVLRQ